MKKVLQGRFWQTSSAWCLSYAEGPWGFKTSFFLRPTGAGGHLLSRPGIHGQLGLQMLAPFLTVGLWLVHSLGEGSPLNSSFCPSRYRPTSPIYRRVFWLPANTPSHQGFWRMGLLPWLGFLPARWKRGALTTSGTEQNCSWFSCFGGASFETII